MRQGASQASAFRDVFELAERAEAWGVDCVWLGEIHFTPVRSVISASLQVASAIASLTYEDILARKVAFGTAAGVIERLTQLREELGLDGIVAELNPGGLIPPELEARSLQILANDVIPAFK